MDQKKFFPKDFLWGASTASHQVEGNTYNQWTVWELAHAQELAKSAEKRLKWLPNWDEVKAQATDPNNYISGKGVNHYKMYNHDFLILKNLNMNSFRFSIEWSRIEPTEGVWQAEAISHYHKYLDRLVELGITPVLNIWHWTLPVWFTDKGGFLKASNIKYFERFVEKLADEYGKKVDYVIVLNEPNVYVSFSYLTGSWPPQYKNVFKFIRVYWNLAKAHKRAYKILKAKNSRLKIGVAAQLANIQAKNPRNILDEIATQWMRYFWNWWFLNRVNKYQDFVGINFYFSDYYSSIVKRRNPRTPVSDLGWYMEPEGLYELLVRVDKHYKKPIMITENGVADAHDQYRQWWLEETVIAMEKALSEGVNIFGYFHWSLLDNFEWAFGWWPKFGLVAVDREHDMKRTVRPSAKWLAAKIKDLQDE